MAEQVRVQVKVIAKAADLPGKRVTEFAELAKKFQSERLQADSREAYLELVEKQDRILKAKAKELGV